MAKPIAFKPQISGVQNGPWTHAEVARQNFPSITTAWTS